MREFANYWYIVGMTILFMRYAWLIWKGRVEPIFTTWLMFSLVTNLSLLTYLGDGKHGMMDNVVNAVDAFWTTGLMLFVVINSREGKRKLFAMFDLYCLALALVLTIFWLTTSAHMLSNLLLQSIMVLAYLPMWKSVWGADDHSEAFSLWGGVTLIQIPAIYWPLVNQDFLAAIYVLRGLLTGASIFVFLLWIELKKYIGRSVDVRPCFWG